MRRGTGTPARAGGEAPRRLRPSLALGRRTVRAARYPAAELHHRPARQRQDPAGSALGRDLARRRLPWPGARSQARLGADRSEEHTSELQSLMRISYAVFCLKKKTITTAFISYTDSSLQRP